MSNLDSQSVVVGGQPVERQKIWIVDLNGDPIPSFSNSQAPDATMFIGGRLVGAGGAGNFSIAQLWNPAGSGANVFVTSWKISAGSAGFLDLRWHNAAIGSPVVSVTPKIIGSGSVPVAKLNTVNNLTATPGNLIGVGSSSATFIQQMINGTIELPPGFGIHSNQLSPNISLSILVEWYEKVI